ncbi:hypothetical protein CGMCC3_g16283 [Colletotrichum fructicola]|nr:uncharacterized protein CGMCC3_g16283 [Colletotrichum fructicola]KAE9567590.1 hypothetical protein CGMCC3_g16283 [Colletotrichum fructicola]
MELQANPLVIRRKAQESFINFQRPSNEGLFGESTVRDDALVESSGHYKKLLPLLQRYLNRDARFDWAENPSHREWKALFDDLAVAESKAAGSDNGPYDIFDRMMLRVGKHADTIDPWINLIPDDFGLCVVKSGFALLLDYARKHSNKRQEIFDAFISLRNILGDASSKGTHFQADSVVSRCAADVYEAIVNSIHELLILVETQKKSEWSLKTRNKNQPKDVQEILQEASERAKALLVTVDNCRDATIKKTGEDASQVLGEVQFIGWKAIEIREAVGNIDKRQNMQMSTLESVQRTQDVMVDLANKIRANYEDNFRAHHNKFQITLTSTRRAFMGPVFS